MNTVDPRAWAIARCPGSGWRSPREDNLATYDNIEAGELVAQPVVAKRIERCADRSATWSPDGPYAPWRDRGSAQKELEQAWISNRLNRASNHVSLRASWRVCGDCSQTDIQSIPVTTITPPFAGVVTKGRPRRRSRQSATALFTIADLSAVWCRPKCTRRSGPPSDY